MDMSFFRRPQGRFQSRSPADVDYETLAATLEACQSATLTAKAQARAAAMPPAARRNDALVDILLGAGGWKEAVPVQGGCFNRRRAAAIASPCKGK